jgi:hypothetical protein
MFRDRGSFQLLDKLLTIAGIIPPVISTKKKPGWGKAYMSHVGCSSACYGLKKGHAPHGPL